jgi:hypothetical protein
VGTGIAYLTRDQLPAALGLAGKSPWLSVLFGTMASGGSGIWNSALDIMREINQQKQTVTAAMKAAGALPLAAT